MNDKIHIRRATVGDRATTLSLYEAMLRKVAIFGHDLKPENAEAHYVAVIEPAIGRGDPVLLAFDGDKAVGALFWCGVATPYGQPKQAFGYGTYVDGSRIRMGIGSRLRSEGVSILKANGVKKLTGMVLHGNEAGHASVISMGMKPTATIYELEVD